MFELTGSVADLPEPKSTYLDRLHPNQDSDGAQDQPEQERPTTPPQPSNPLQEPSSVQSRRSNRESLGAFEADPWAAPELHRDHGHSQIDNEPSILNGFGNDQSAGNSWSDGRAFEEAYRQTISNGERPNGLNVAPAPAPAPSSSESGWGGSLPRDTGFGGFGLPPTSNPGEISNRRRSLGAGRITTTPVEETITVTLLPEKEGLFMFQHRNYEVKSARRGSTVVRRYSDFVWLLDCLQKRYPFRQLPLLPPKRISGKC